MDSENNMTFIFVSSKSGLIEKYYAHKIGEKSRENQLFRVQKRNRRIF